MPRINVLMEKILKNKKYSFVFILLAVGIILVFFSSVKKTEKPPALTEEKRDILKLKKEAEKELSEFLLCVEGIDYCRVMIFYKNEGTTVYLKNSISSEREEESKKEISSVLRREGGNEYPLEEKYIPPEIGGATVIIKGRGITEEKAAKAVSRAIGVEIHNVEVIINERN